MSQCKTGCERLSSGGYYLCGECTDAWEASPERKRAQSVVSSHAVEVAFVDFCTRVRAERQNGKKP